MDHMSSPKTSTNKRVSVSQRKQQQRRPTVNDVLASSSTLKKSSSSGTSNGNGNGINDSDEEIRLMESAEYEQTLVDRFWGKDKEDKDRMNETALFETEERHSKAYDNYCKTYGLWQHWEMTYKEIKMRTAYGAAVREQQERQAYLSSILQSKTSDEVMAYKWRTKPHVVASDHQSNYNAIGVIRTTTNAATNAAPNAYNMNNSLSESSTTSTFILPEPFDGLRTSVHLDGMQQALALITNPTTPGQLGPTVRSRTATEVIEKTMAEQRMNGGSAPSRSTALGRGASGASKSIMNASRLHTVDGKEIKLTNAPTVSHVEELDGHPVFKWDQYTILRAAYNKISVVDGAVVTVTTLIATIANNKAVVDLLRFTVYGPWVKRRSWTEFLSKFGKSVSNQEASHTMSDYNAHATITLADWLDTARELCIEKRVSRQHIRSEAKHRKCLMVDGPWVQLLEKGKPGWFAERTREYTGWDLEEAYLSRQVAVGDVVYALAGRGTTWLPAKIERVNKRDTSITGGAAAVITYDLRYIFTQTEIIDARSKSASRRLLALNNKLESREKEEKQQPIDPLPAYEEKRILEHAFDIVDVDKKGALSASLLVSALKSETMDMVVRSAVSLKMLIDGSSRVNGKRFRYPFKQAFADIFEGDPEDDDSISGMITKQEFVDFCLYAADINTFNAC